MQILDFEYDGIKLSDMGYMLCNFNKNDDSRSDMVEITFDKVSTLHGEKWDLTNSNYESCLEATFSICKNKCQSLDSYVISTDDYRLISRWLNRKDFHKFRAIGVDGEFSEFYFEGSFNIKKKEIEGRLYGLDLTLYTNRPFALQNERTYKFCFETNDAKCYLIDSSDEIGYIYPEMEIKVLESGDLKITNLIENREMSIKNCIENEIIYINYPIIYSSIDTHKIQDDFNWIFFRIANNFKENKNTIISNLKCEMEIQYFPIAKISL